MAALAAVAEAIARASGRPFAIAGSRETGGGCINGTHVLTGANGARWFVKINRAERLDMFEAEAEGLREIASAQALRVPEPLAVGADAERAWLVLEYIDFHGLGDAVGLGHGLAAMHRRVMSRPGWHRDNTIGATPQANTPCDTWIEFWRDRRLLWQLRLAERNGLGRRGVSLGERLAAGMAGFFPGYSPVASLLHGDLWGGNVAYAGGQPVIYDPAVYYGDREADLAMTELFGGFGAAFQAAYREVWPLDPGYAQRRDLYNLYHILNHFNLFGGGYGAQAIGMMERLLASLK
jgi:fructosamine-3-kinase